MDAVDLLSSADAAMLVRRLAQTGRLWIDVDGTWLEPDVRLEREKILLKLDIGELGESD